MNTSRNSNIFRNLDWVTIAIYIGLMVFGWLNIYGACYTFDQTSIFDFSNRAGKQFVWIIGALVLGGVLLLIDHNTYEVLAYILYAVMLLVLLITPLVASDIKGSLSWISMGPLRLQPAEFAKCITALALAKYMGRYGYEVRTWRDLIVPFALIAAPVFIIMVPQKETGSALVFAAFLLVLYRRGMSGYVLWCGVAAVALFTVSIRFGAVPLPFGTGNVGILACMLLICAINIFFLRKENRLVWEPLILIGVAIVVFGIGMLVNIWFPVNFDWLAVGVAGLLTVYTAVVALYWRHHKLLLVALFSVCCIGFTYACDYVFNHILQDHQRTRIEVLFGMKDDPTGAGYNVNQARIAIGSGGFIGKGYLNGTQTKLQFVPEQGTDFIFCTVGEEWGFVGSVAVLIVYLCFILRLISLAERQRSIFSQVYGYSVASIFLMHLTINVGMVLGLLPVIGIPLPFFSYGGSSLWGFTILLFIFLRLDAARTEKMF